MSTSVQDTIIKKREDLELSDFAFHPLVEARLKNMLENQYVTVLDTADPSDVVKIAKAQEGKSLITTILALPQRILKEEREKRAKQ